MTQYRGYYIDHNFFHSKSDIDNFIKKQNINTYKMMCRRFNENSTMELNKLMVEKADWLHKFCGVSYEELEAIEIEAITA